MTTKLTINNVKIEQALVPNTYSADTVTGAIDTQGYEAISFVVNTGAFSDTAGGAYFDMEVQHSDDTVAGNFTAVAASNLSSTVVSGAKTNVFAHIDDTLDGGQAYSVGYLGGKRYVRLSLDFNGTHSTGTKIAASSIKARPNTAPVV